MSVDRIPKRLAPWPRRFLEDLLLLCATRTHPLQAVHCPCGAAAWANVRDVSHAQRDAEIECPVCGAWSFWHIRRRKPDLAAKLELVGTEKPPPAKRGLWDALRGMR